MKTCPKCGTQYTGATSFCPRDGEALADDHTEMIGRVLDGQYEIEEFIAEGGMGAVYRARHTLLSDRVAIKILPAEMRRNAAWLKRFQREGQAARRFHHPNSVIVHDLRTSEEGEIYLVMEFVEGRTLDEEVAARGGRLSPAESLRIIEPVASVLDAAHTMGVVHRDLKPSNIMITKQGKVKLLDLGLAKVSDLGTTQLTMTGQLLGTPYYMSPEQWGELPRDGREEIDGRTDVYSLGVVVFQITTGAFPFNGTSSVALRRAHCHEIPRPPEEINPAIPPGWSRAVLRALSKDRNDRQATAGELARELRASLGGTAAAQEHARTAAPTLIVERRETPRGVHETPQNLAASTVNVGGSSFTEYSPAGQQVRNAPFAGRQPKSSRAALVLVAVAAILILVGGGFALWKWGSGRKAVEKQAAVQAKAPANGSSDTSTSADTTGTAGGERTAAAGEAFMRYHLLLSRSPLDEQQASASGREPIAAGQIVQFTFESRASGYLYMLGHDDAGNFIVIPLGDTEAAGKIEAGAEAVFPSLPFVRLDAASGAEDFTVIFSDKPLALPFASGTLPLDGSFRKLTAGELRQIEDLRRQAAPATIEFEGEKENETGAVRLADERGTKPVLFDIKLKLQR